MRVLHVTRYGSVVGGAETYIGALSEGQRKAGHEVSWLYGLDGDPARPEVVIGAQLDCLIEPGTHPSQREDDAGRLLDAVAEREPHVVHAHVPDIAWVAPLLRARYPTLLAVHDHRVSCPTGTRYWRTRRKRCDVRPGFKCLAHNVISGCGSLKANATLRPFTVWTGARTAAKGIPIQVFSSFMRDQVVGLVSISEDVTVTPYPVPPAAAPAEIPAGDRPVVYSSGRLNHEKGFAQLISSLEHVSQGVELVIAGDGYLKDALRRMRVAPRHRVRLLGWVGPDVAAGWRARADVVVVPSVWPEPFGIVGIEAMSDGKPVVAFGGGGIGQWLEDGVTGVAVAPGDLRALGTAISAVLSDPATALRMGEAGRARARERFALTDHVRAIDDLYEKVRRTWVAA